MKFHPRLPSHGYFFSAILKEGPHGLYNSSCNDRLGAHLEHKTKVLVCSCNHDTKPTPSYKHLRPGQTNQRTPKSNFSATTVLQGTDLQSEIMCWASDFTEALIKHVTRVTRATAESDQQTEPAIMWTPGPIGPQIIQKKTAFHSKFNPHFRTHFLPHLFFKNPTTTFNWKKKLIGTIWCFSRWCVSPTNKTTERISRYHRPRSLEQLAMEFFFQVVTLQLHPEKCRSCLANGFLWPQGFCLIENMCFPKWWIYFLKGLCILFLWVASRGFNANISIYIRGKKHRLCQSFEAPVACCG